MLKPIVPLCLSLLVAAHSFAAEKWERLNEEAPFVVSLAQDKQGSIWIGTEDKGVFRYDPAAEELLRWSHFTTKDGLGDDNAYAIACDKLGRVWVGTLNHGVSVFNGDKWKTYDVLDGPIGERIFAIATCPTDGDVWMATSAGLTRYSMKNDDWTHYTRAEGLPSDQADALAFDQLGNLYVGTQCDGIAIGNAGSGYKRWAVRRSPTNGVNFFLPGGDGIPSSQIHALLVARDGTVYAGTNAGLAIGASGGETWKFLRGRDYGAKVRGRFGGAPRGWQEAPKPLVQQLLPEDYITALAEDDTGMIWVGFRQQGCAVLKPKTLAIVLHETAKTGLLDDYVRSILPFADGRPFVATYGQGLARAKGALPVGARKPKPAAAAKKEQAPPPPLPIPAKPPTLAELKALLEALDKVPAEAPKQVVLETLGDDWKTQGTWIERYGKYGGVLCALAGGGRDVPTGVGEFDWHGSIGRNCTKGDQLRHWIHWQQTDNPRSLQWPTFGRRRQAEQDDHGEVYPMSQDGPHVYDTLSLPPGQYILSFYFFNKDGHDGPNRFRDFLVEIRPTPMTDAVFRDLGQPGKSAEPYFEKQSAVQARGRVHTFWGGAYKRFYVNVADGCYTVRVNRNSSFNTIISGIFIDPVAEMHEDLGRKKQPPKPRPSQEEHIRLLRNHDPAAVASLLLMDRLLWLRSRTPRWYAHNSRRYLLPLLRRLLDNADGTCLAEKIEKNREWFPVRVNVVECLRDAQLFDRRDAIYYDFDWQLRYRWLMNTKHGYKKWKPNSDEYLDFLKRENAAKSWKSITRGDGK